jgi:threonine dehydrogenase-like Zn-dependent dehydrogenase
LLIIAGDEVRAVVEAWRQIVFEENTAHNPSVPRRADRWMADPVFDRVTNIDGVPDGYRAMNDREAIKVMIES